MCRLFSEEANVKQESCCHSVTKHRRVHTEAADEHKEAARDGMKNVTFPPEIAPESFRVRFRKRSQFEGI